MMLTADVSAPHQPQLSMHQEQDLSTVSRSQIWFTKMLSDLGSKSLESVWSCQKLRTFLAVRLGKVKVQSLVKLKRGALSFRIKVELQTWRQQVLLEKELDAHQSPFD